MMKSVFNVLCKMNHRLLAGVMLLLAGVLLFEGWLLLLHKPYAEYQQIRVNRASLAPASGQTSDPSGELGRMAEDIRQLRARLSGEMSTPASDEEMAASLLTALDHSAATHGVTLSGVKPMEKKQVSLFEEVVFEVSATGAYLQLCEWMLDFGKTLGSNATVTDFDLKMADAGRQVILTMNISLYRPLIKNGAVK
ncbi:MAG: type 4a pilus biogenesis protein PilO [Gallionella sp.]|nr:type 4a pilus biogenesis protein PilO [Gallionella sp.]